MTYIFLTFLAFYVGAVVVCIVQMNTAPRNREIDSNTAWQTARLAVVATENACRGLAISDEDKFKLACGCFKTLTPKLCPTLSEDAIITLVRGVMTKSE